MCTVWHLGAGLPCEQVNGVHNTVWLLARQQVQDGLNVSVIVPRRLNSNAVRAASAVGVSLRTFPAALRALSKSAALPHRLVVHMHSVFKLEQALVAGLLRARGVPWVVTPHGGVSPNVLARGRWKKTSYSALLERPRFRHAAAITVVAPAEESDVRAFIPNYEGIVRWIPNPVGLPDMLPARLLPQNRPVLTYMGRLDAWQKGIDRLVELAGRLPEADFDLYSSDTAHSLGRMRLPGNVRVRPPVYGTTKWLVLRSSTMYIQCSRWEPFGISAAEAMGAGVPCALASEMDMSQLVQEHGLGLVLTGSSSEDGPSLRGLLADRNAIIDMGAKAASFVRHAFSPAAVAEQYERLYREASCG